VRSHSHRHLGGNRVEVSRRNEDRGYAMSSDAPKEATRRAWRELGFFCDRNDATNEWRIVGSVKGLETEKVLEPFPPSVY
jgi:hypothetical protein